MHVKSNLILVLLLKLALLAQNIVLCLKVVKHRIIFLKRSLIITLSTSVSPINDCVSWFLWFGTSPYQVLHQRFHYQLLEHHQFLHLTFFHTLTTLHLPAATLLFGSDKSNCWSTETAVFNSSLFLIHFLKLLQFQSLIVA